MSTLNQSLAGLIMTLKIQQTVQTAAFDGSVEIIRGTPYSSPPIEPPKNLPAYQQLKKGKRGKIKKW